MKKLHIALPSSVLINGSIEEKAFYSDYSNDDTHKLKMLLIMLSISNYNSNNNIKNDTIRLNNINSTKSFFRTLRLSKDKIISVCKSLENSLFIDDVNVIGDDVISFTVKPEYQRLLLNSKTVYIDFDSIAKYRKVNHIKAHFKCVFFKDLKGSLNYFVDFFGNNKSASYSNKVSQVKRIFNAVSIVEDVQLDKSKGYDIKVKSVNVFQAKIEVESKSENIIKLKKVN